MKLIVRKDYNKSAEFQVDKVRSYNTTTYFFVGKNPHYKYFYDGVEETFTEVDTDNLGMDREYTIQNWVVID